MALSETFCNAVKSGDVTRVRIMMKDSLLLDLTFRNFSEMEAYTRVMPGLYDEHDGREVITDKSEWDDDYMNLLMAQVIYNFSHERIEHLKNVIRYLRPAPAPSPKSDVGQNRNSSSSHFAGTSTKKEIPPSQNRKRKLTAYEEQQQRDREAGRISDRNNINYREQKQADIDAGLVSSEITKKYVIGCTITGAVIGGVTGFAASSGAVGGVICGVTIGGAVGAVGGVILSTIISKGGY